MWTFAYLFFVLHGRAVLKDPIRGFLTFIGITLGVSTLIAVMVLNEAALQGLRSDIESLSGAADVVVLGEESGLAEELLDLIQNEDGVAAAAPILELYVRVKADDRRPMLLLGIDTLLDTGVRSYTAEGNVELSDQLEFLAIPDSVVITTSLARRLGLRMESRLEVITPLGLKTLTVRGMLEPTGAARAFGGRVLLMDVYSAQEVFHLRGRFHRIDVVVTEGVSTADVIERLARKMPSGVSLETPRSRGRSAGAMIATFQTGLMLVSSLALFIAMFLIYNTFSISLVRRKRWIGTQQALGASQAGVLARHLMDAMVLGILGSALGIGIGYHLARWMMPAVGRAVETLYTPLTSSHQPLTPRVILMGLGLGTGAAILGALRPVWRATRTAPLAAMLPGYGRIRTRSATWKKAVVGLVLLLVQIPAYALLRVWPSPLWGILLVFTLLVSGILLLPLVIVTLLREWRKRYRRGGISTFLTTDAVTENPGRTSLATGSLLIGLAVVIAIATVLNSFRFSITQWLDKALRADFQVSACSEFAGTMNTPLHEQVGEELEGIEGVEAVDRYRKLRITLNGTTTHLASIDMAVYLQKNELIYRAGDRAKGLQESVRGNGALVSENFARQFGLKLDDEFQVNAPAGPCTLKVSAIIVDYTSEQGIAFVDTHLLKEYWGNELVDIFLVHLEPGADIDKVTSQIESQYGARYNLLITRRDQLMANALGFLEHTFALTRAVEVAALVCALLGILNTLMASVLERERELGVMRAIGATPGQVFRLILSEALWIAMLGVGGGLVAGVAVSLVVVEVVIPNLQGFSLGYDFAGMTTLRIILIVVGATLSAGLYPAWRAVRIKLNEVIGYE